MSSSPGLVWKLTQGLIRALPMSCPLQDLCPPQPLARGLLLLPCTSDATSLRCTRLLWLSQHADSAERDTDNGSTSHWQVWQKNHGVFSVCVSGCGMRSGLLWLFPSQGKGSQFWPCPPSYHRSSPASLPFFFLRQGFSLLTARWN